MYSSEKRRVFLVDDHPIVREGLAQLIDAQEDLCVSGQAENVRDAMQAMSEDVPDAAVVDISLKDESGIDLVRTLRQRVGDLPILVLSIHDENLFAERALKAGARGYIMKQEASETVLEGLRRILAGHVFLSPVMAGKLLKKVSGDVEPVSPLELLSDREMQIFQMIGMGRETREIADVLHISVKTIESHYSNIKRKLGVASMRDLMRHAMVWALEGRRLDVEPGRKEDL